MHRIHSSVRVHVWMQGCVPDAAESAAAKEAGKADFKGGRFESACSNYSRALQMLQEQAPASSDEAASALYADRALCLLRLLPPAAEAAHTDCSAAISCDPANHKVASLTLSELGLCTCIAWSRKNEKAVQLSGVVMSVG